MDGDDMPHCLDLLFRPTKEMKFFEYELAIAAYIFGNNLDPKEMLIPDDYCMGTRKTLLTIMPGKPIIGDKCSGTMKYIKDNFMGDLGGLHEIFVPIHLNGHWFLIVVNLLYKTVRYMDSFKGCTSMTVRKGVIDDVLTYLEKFVSDKNFQETPSHENLQFSKYKFSEPAVPQQKAKSNDCGIWVAEWMILNHYWGVNKPWVVNDYSRLRLAVDLVYKWHNPKRHTIKDLAVADWNKKMQQSVLKT
ncbi:hypothetical protein Ahy_A06g026176 [Arachis hypogaea]|uniref:Ubiquitin-like protease family profile domain-containing protein n=1 Tax=Arachis hypogaea TaxID=3818 RepID=A0A445CJM8_ARAHY|nr:hypothetical protein Ahy_A06g026176 [Arachis hypogaea]